MTARVNFAGEITLPGEVLKELELQPGSEVAFERGPNGEIVLVKAAEAPKRTAEEVRRSIESVRGTAKPGLTTEKFMQLTRGDD